jgi:predicted phosphohydrolase
LEASLLSAAAKGLTPLVFLHYPPICGDDYNYDILDVLYKYGVKRCFYGHLHGGRAHSGALCGVRDDIEFELVSSDFVQFKPKLLF